MVRAVTAVQKASKQEQFRKDEQPPGGVPERTVNQ